MPNRLAGESSPYLLQHKDNPVDWYPWGDEAFAVAADFDRPILLSVGYSTCHWCHVMERESFEDEDTAALMNAHFVSVKVDREERPDVDSIYMDAVNAMTGRGGWPMTVFLTPAGEPFYAGTYFPNVERHGMPSFQRVLGAIHDAWTNRRTEIAAQAAQLTQVIGQALPAGDGRPGGSEVAAAYHTLVHQYDEEHGGLGGAPKFPQEPVLEFLLRLHDAPWAEQAGEMASHTLERMAAGGIYDHLGGGFARYAVDGIWLVPHFEKMLYDNAELARLSVRAWQVTGTERLRQVARETLDYLLRDMLDPSGGIYAAEDADSEGVEGKFYVFDHDTFHEVVGTDDAAIAATHFGVRPEGTFEGTNVLHLALPIEDTARHHDVGAEAVEAAVDRARTRLFDHRSRRVRPGLDAKVIVAWNGLALRAMAVAGDVLDEARYLDAARKNAEFVLGRMRMSDGRLYRTWSPGTSPSIPGYLEDHAAYALGLLELFQATAETRWLDEALVIIELLEPHFGGPEGVIYASAADASNLIVRPADQHDNPVASGASLAAEAYLIAGQLTGRTEWLDAAERIIAAATRLIERAPAAAGHLLAVLAGIVRGPREVALLGPEALEWRKRLAKDYHPRLVVAASADSSEIPLLKDRHRDGQTLAYVCESMVCQTPVDSYEALTALL